MPERHKRDKTKANTWILWEYEQKWIAWAVPKIPQFINGKNLTWTTAVWGILLILSGYLTQYNISWIWAISGLIILQYITDSLDGALGRYRNSGLVKWGHYVDHLLDFTFLCSVIIGYAFVAPDTIYLLLVNLALFTSHMASAFLRFGFSEKFRMSASGVGMNEMKIGLIVLNICIYFFGTFYLKYVFGVVAVLAFLALIQEIYRGQREAEEIDKGRN